MPERPPETPPDGSSDDSSHDLDEALDRFLEIVGPAGGAAPPEGLPALGAMGELGPGSVLGDFVLEESLGFGGMGVVFKATQTSVPGRVVAVKVLRNLFGAERVHRRFLREIAIIGKLDHPGIVPIVAAGVERGIAYYAMPFMHGLTASHFLKELVARGGRPETAADALAILAPHEPPGPGASARNAEERSESYSRWVARWIAQVADCLHYAHEHGVVHRDVKPANIVLSESKRPMLVDFGLASTFRTDETLTLGGEFIGTLAYASPEQVRGDPLDERADVYALGSTFYELLAHRKVFDATSRSEWVRKIEFEEPVPLPRRIPVDLRRICMAALVKDRDRRYASAGSVAHDLREFLAGRPISVRTPGLARRTAGWIRRHPTVSLVTIAVLVLLLGSRVRDHLRAASLVRRGNEALAGALETRDALFESYASYLASFEPGASVSWSDRLRRDELRAEVKRKREEVEAAFRSVEALHVAAFDHVAGFRPGRFGLARLHAERLGLALRLHDDVLRPAVIADLTDRLRTFDRSGRYADLTETTGRITIATRPTGARVEILREGSAEPLRSGVSPLRAEGLPEGSYLARITSDDVYADLDLPILVRRDGSYRVGVTAPPRDIDAELLRSECIPEGFVCVPAGWTLVEDDPPRWEHVDLVIMQEMEVTYGAWLEYLNDPGFPESLQSVGSKPRYRESMDALHVRMGPDGRFELLPEHRADWPVRGVTRMEMGHYALLLNRGTPVHSKDWYYSLPTEEEWVRAARGSDGRPYPWGRTFSWDRCGGYLSGNPAGAEQQAYPVGQFAADVSPFGVRDLAGSVHEVTIGEWGPVRGVFPCRGGSFESVDVHEMEVTHRIGVKNEPREDIGFRLVFRRMPEWMRRPVPVVASFVDDFERPDADDVGGGWHEVAARPLEPPNDPGTAPGCSVVDGKLVLEGGTGSFSNAAEVWRPFTVAAPRFTISMVCALSHSEAEHDGRTMEIVLASGFPQGIHRLLSARITYDDRIQLGMTPGIGAQYSEHAPAPVSSVAGRPFRVEFRGDETVMEGRIWPEDGERPERPAATMAVTAEIGELRFLGISAPNLIGSRVEVEEIDVRVDRPDPDRR